MAIDKILVPVDFSPCSDAALDYALNVADQCGAEVEVLHVWSPHERKAPVPMGGPADELDADQGPVSEIFADTPEGVALERRLSEADRKHAARVSGRLEYGTEPSSVILSILDRERFDLVVMGNEGEGHRREHCEGRSDHESGHVAAGVAQTTACKVVTCSSAGTALPADVAGR